MAVFEAGSYIAEIEQDITLRREENFEQRAEIIDDIEFYIDSLPDDLIQDDAGRQELYQLRIRAEKIKCELKEINSNLFRQLREAIKQGLHAEKGFKVLIEPYFDLNCTEGSGKPGYDNLDIFINGLFHFHDLPEPTVELEPEMIYYQKTPAMVILELTEKCHFTAEDVFLDLGSGLGQAAILVNLLTGVKAIGVELEPAFCRYAADCATSLGLTDVTIVNADAREADFSAGTVFFMYTPFRGKILENVLQLLRKESLQRKIRLITYGPCTAEVSRQTWLYSANKGSAEYKLKFFYSL